MKPGAGRSGHSKDRRLVARRLRAIALASALSVLATVVAGPGSAWGQTPPLFSADPTTGPVGTTITVHSTTPCTPPPGAGDWVAIVNVAQGTNTQLTYKNFLIDTTGNWGGTLTIPTTTSTGPAQLTAACFDATNHLTTTITYQPVDYTVTPATTITLTPTSPNGSNDWYTVPVRAAVVASDGAGGSGIAETRCVVDPTTIPRTFGDLPVGQCSLVDVAADGTHTIYAASVDNAGYESPVASSDFKIDTTGPTVNYTGNALVYLVDQRVNIECVAADPGTGASGISSTTCSNLVGPAAGFGLGLHAYSATATDNAGNTGTGATSFTVAVTPVSLCNLTLQFVHGSPKYLASGRTKRLGINEAVESLCADTLTPVKPGIKRARKAALIAAYRRGVTDLVADKWLTPAQDAALTAFAGAL
jgi:hypothetical protein